MFAIEVNGERHEAAEGETVAQLLVRLGLKDRKVAVELDGELLPRTRHDTALHPGSRLEIVSFVGGG